MTNEQMTGKHTPGPWHIEEDIEVYANNRFVAMTLPCDGEIGTAEDYANARLIAAAPELLDASNALLGLLQLISARHDTSSELREVLETNHRVEEARTAIAKVKMTGEL